VIKALAALKTPHCMKFPAQFPPDREKSKGKDPWGVPIKGVRNLTTRHGGKGGHGFGDIRQRKEKGKDQETPHCREGRKNPYGG